MRKESIDYCLLGQNIQAFRTQLNKPLDETAHQIGLHPDAFSDIEKGLRKPSLEIFLRIAAALNVTADALLQGQNIK